MGARAIWTFEVFPDDGEPYEVDASSRDVMAWEKSSRKTLKYLYEHMPITEMNRVAYLAAKRQGLFDGTEADFFEACDIQISKDDEDAPDPTRRGR